MTMTKELLQEAVTKMPDEFPLDELMEKLILRQNFDEGRRQYREGQYYTHEEMKQRFARWLK